MTQEYEGSVVIYTIEGCPHCKAAKSTLSEIEIPFKEILLNEYSSDLRKWLKDRTKKSSVPQIFFNEKYIGGNVELQELVKDENKWSELIKGIKENPTPIHGEMALYIPSPDSKIPLDIQEGLHEFSCEPDEYASLVEELKESGIMGSHKKGGLFSENVKHSVTGEQIMTWLKNAKGFSQDKGLKIGGELLSRKFMLKVNHEDDTNFEEDSHSLYRVQVGADTNFPLNGGEISTCVQRSAEIVAEER
ncbi:unnamed protein product [Lepeophtheirus salmonis]|uniref:(salmon louse) hypothetical protein n=1 Tax=Lepeophtheirus salmonis TaxID=72036 RepID=A0A7R8H6Q1_LEPSM|nr:unnamed protein product [Lepeophtheirus salmonis]CAF2901243.1 unnamed protein product [Lepeophtheirus salmonis]